MLCNSFSNEKGLLWKLNSSYTSRYRLVIGITTDWFSTFPEEAEVLLINQYLPIQDTTNYEQGGAEGLVNQLLYMLKDWQSHIVDKKQFYKQLGFPYKKKWHVLFCVLRCFYI